MKISKPFLVVVGIALLGLAAATNRTQLLRSYLYDNMDGNGQSITNLSSVTATNFNGVASKVATAVTNQWKTDATNATLGVISPMATNAVNATNFWGLLSLTNLPATVVTNNAPLLANSVMIGDNGRGVTNATLSEVLDLGGATQGSLISRGASAWSLLTPGPSNAVLRSLGSGQDLAWGFNGIGLTNIQLPYAAITNAPTAPLTNNETRAVTLASNLNIAIGGVGVTVPTNQFALVLSNSTPAAAGAPQNSPALELHSSGYSSNGSASVDQKWMIYDVAANAAGVPTDTLTFARSVSNGAPVNAMTLGRGGFLSLLDALQVPASSAMYIQGRIAFKASASARLQILNGSESAGAQVEALSYISTNGFALPVLTTPPAIVVTNGAQLWSDGTNVNVVAQNAGGIKLTNTLQFGGYGNLAMGTGAVTHTATTLLFGGYNYTKVSGNIGVETNTTLVVTNAGDYRVSFGSLIGGVNGDTIYLSVITNGVICSIVKLGFTTTATATSETGFKEFVVTLPALCRIGLSPTNANSATMTLQNTTLNVRLSN